MEQNKLIALILQFDKTVRKANELFATYYDLSVPPLIAWNRKIIPKEGSYQLDDWVVDFCFHGIGCRVMLNGIVVDFDYERPFFDYQGFDQWKFIWFLTENHFRSFENRDKQYSFFRELEELAELGFLIMHPDLEMSEKFGYRVNQLNAYDYKVNPDFSFE